MLANAPISELTKLIGSLDCRVQQWDAQETVLAVREHFASLGIATWMDIDGGMQTDIFDSMAQGVSNAAAVVVFMSQRYQDSENCKLELKFTKQQSIPIVPVPTPVNISMTT